MNNSQSAIKKAMRVREIAQEIENLVDEAKHIAKSSGVFYANYDAFVFQQILEHCNKGNPYNRDLMDLAKEVEDSGVEEEEEDEVEKV